jgi:hypothetical protein|nr:hypothetical protein [uncultured Campylobacter sp.]
MENQEPKKLELSKDYSAEILSWYLWGQSKAPSKAEMADAKWIGREENITLEVNTQEFLKKAGDFVNAKDFRSFKTFFSGKTVSGNKLNNGNPTLNEGQYERFENGLYFLTQEQFANLFYGEYKDNKELDKNKKLKSDIYDAAKEPTLNKNPALVSLYNRNIDNPDFAKLAFTFGSMKVGLNTSKIRYVLDENLNPILVKDIEYQFEAGDFDFKGGKGSGPVNHILNQIADPSAIGKTVKFKFTGETIIDGGSINKNNYDSMKELKEYEVDSNSKLLDSDFYKVMLLKFWPEFDRIVSTGVIDYLDENNKIVMFRGNEKDKMVGTQAANFNFSNDIKLLFKPIEGFDVEAFIPFRLLNHYIKYIPNGITYVGGKGDDTIDEMNGILERKDRMMGGEGFDTYYVGRGDTIEDSDGRGKVFFDRVALTGGTYNRDKGVYLSEDGKTEYKLEEDRLIVKRGVSTITINGYKKDFKDEGGNAYLNIALVDSVEIEVTLHGGVISEGNQKEMSGKFKISLDKELKSKEYITLKIHDNNVNNKEQIVKLTSKNYNNSFYEFYWEGDAHANQDKIYSASAEVIDKSDIIEVRIKSEKIVIKDDDRICLFYFWLPSFQFYALTNTGPEYGIPNLMLWWQYWYSSTFMSVFHLQVDYNKDFVTDTGKAKYGYIYRGGELEVHFPSNDLIENKIAVWDSNHGKLGVLYDRFPDYSLLEKHLLLYKKDAINRMSEYINFENTYIEYEYDGTRIFSIEECHVFIDNIIKEIKIAFLKTKEIFENGPQPGEYTIPVFNYNFRRERFIFDVYQK